MSNINFLPTKNKGDVHKRSDKSDKKEEIKLSKPDEDILAEDKEKSSGWFSFFKKDSVKGRKLKEEKFNKNNLKHSRQEVLQLIKEYARDQDSSIKSQASKIKTKKESNPLAWIRKLRKSKDDKAILVDYQQDFKEKQTTDDRRQTTDGPAMSFRSNGTGRRQTIPTALQHKAGAVAEKSADDKKKKEKKKKISVYIPTNVSTSAPADVKAMAGKKAAADKKILAGKKANADSKEKKWGNPDILETNLIKGEIIFLFNWRKGIIKLSIMVVLTCLAIGAVYGGLDFWQKQKEEETRKIAQKFIKLNQQISQAEQGVDEILAWQRKLSLVSALLDNHIYWTNFFKFLEDNTLVDVYFPGGFSGDTSGNYNLSAVGVNYNTIHQQVKTLKILDQVVKVSVTSGNFAPTGEDGQSSINFNLELSVDSEIFYK